MEYQGVAPGVGAFPGEGISCQELNVRRALFCFSPHLPRPAGIPPHRSLKYYFSAGPGSDIFPAIPSPKSPGLQAARKRTPGVWSAHMRPSPLGYQKTEKWSRPISARNPARWKKKGDEKNMEEMLDALQAAPNVTKLIMENDRVRVFDVWFKPGEKAAMHKHPDHVMYIFNDGKLKMTTLQGETQEVDLKTGQVIWMDAVSHTVENLGKTGVHFLVVELKE